MGTTPTNTDDFIDSRDVIARIEVLESEIETATNDNELDLVEEEVEELATLKALAKEGEASPDWQYGEVLIRDSYFEEYAQDLAEDCGMIQEGAGWPNTCIDWEQAARDLQMDYSSVDFDGVDYWIRA